MAKKNSTVTLADDRSIVPWLAATGELAYSPEAPTNRRYHFQYGWHMPNAFKDKRIHYYFGRSSSFTENCGGTESYLRSFWQKALDGTHHKVFVEIGKISSEGFKAPIACYDHRGKFNFDTGFILMQQGSYQLVPHKDQPLLPTGYLELYRGIGNAEVFNFLDIKNTNGKNPILKKYWEALEYSFSDSEIAFQVAHSFVKRTETYYLADELSWYDVAKEFGLDIVGNGLSGHLARFHSDSFGLSEQLVKSKFGPNYVKFSTPATNVRLTSFFAGEYEVNVIDPRLLMVVEARGCEISYACIDDKRF